MSYSFNVQHMVVCPSPVRTSAKIRKISLVCLLYISSSSKLNCLSSDSFTKACYVFFFWPAKAAISFCLYVLIQFGNQQVNRCWRFFQRRIAMRHFCQYAFGVSNGLRLHSNKPIVHDGTESFVFRIWYSCQFSKHPCIIVSMYRSFIKIEMQKKPIFECLITICYFESVFMGKGDGLIEIFGREVIFIKHYPTLVVQTFFSFGQPPLC